MAQANLNHIREIVRELNHQEQRDLLEWLHNLVSKLPTGQSDKQISTSLEGSSFAALAQHALAADIRFTSPSATETDDYLEEHFANDYLQRKKS